MMLFLRIPGRTQTTHIHSLEPCYECSHCLNTYFNVAHIHVREAYIYHRTHPRVPSARFIEHKVFECMAFSLRAPTSDLALGTQQIHYIAHIHTTY